MVIKKINLLNTALFFEFIFAIWLFFFSGYFLMDWHGLIELIASGKWKLNYKVLLGILSAFFITSIIYRYDKKISKRGEKNAKNRKSTRTNC